MIVGGGNLAGTGILERFIDLTGGADQLIVVIPSAGEDDAYDESWDGLRQLRAAGARQLRGLHTRDRKAADTETFAAPPSGRRAALDARRAALAPGRFLSQFARGGVIGGTAVGATIQGRFMVRGDTMGNEVMIGDHARGLWLP